MDILLQSHILRIGRKNGRILSWEQLRKPDERQMFELILHANSAEFSVVAINASVVLP